MLLLSGIGIKKRIHINTSQDCKAGKMTWSTLKPRVLKSKAPGQVIFSDVCGIFPTEILGGGKYFFTFIDGYSSYLSKYIIQQNSKVKDKLIHFKTFFEKQFDAVIKKFYTENGGEYVALSGYLQENEIVWESTAPCTPQQNGISERTNRTLMNMIRAMLNESALPPEFWAEAVMTALSLRNMTGQRKLQMKTPIETITGMYPMCSTCEFLGAMCGISIAHKTSWRGEVEKVSRSDVCRTVFIE